MSTIVSYKNLKYHFPVGGVGGIILMLVEFFTRCEDVGLTLVSVPLFPFVVLRVLGELVANITAVLSVWTPLVL